MMDSGTAGTGTLEINTLDNRPFSQGTPMDGNPVEITDFAWARIRLGGCGIAMHRA